MSSRRWLLLVLALLLITPAQAEWHREEVAMMGTRIRVELWHADPAVARQGIAAVLEEMRRIDASMSPYKPDSELSRINAEAGHGPVAINRELLALIQRSLDFSELSQGAFDITFASIGHMYDYRQRQRPDADSVRQALPAIDYRHVVLDHERGTIRFAREGVRIDLGGIAKGYAVERGAEILRRLGIEHAEVNAGGDSRILGDHRGRPWMVGVRDPRDENKIIVQLPLIDEAISTSGDYERYFDQDGIRHHHIINPGTGNAVSGVHSVSVIGPDGTSTDALSTSVFVLGVEKGLQLIDSLPEYEAIVIDNQGKLHFSSGLMQLRG